MLKAHLIKTQGLKSIYYTKKNKKGTIQLKTALGRIITNKIDPVRKNLEDVIELRNTSTHFIIEDYNKRSGITKELTPHVFRHTFATQLLNSGVDIRYVQELLGHTSIATTQFYTHVSKKALRDVYLKTHPFAKEDE